ncbi:MAG: SDR family NAD(P)-dependent oxidoreductase [archaeon]
MELKGKRVLVTGAGGFIGSHLTEELVKMGSKVRALVRYNSDGNIKNLKELPKEILNEIEIIRGDLKNYDCVKRAVKDVDVVFHLGALISIPYSYDDPRDFVETNIIGTLNILQASREYDVKKVVVTSTSEVYGTAIYSPMNEKHPLQAQSPYSATKISADKLAESFYRTYNLPVATIRPFNTYGPRQSMRAVIPTIIYQALTNDKIKLGSLSPKRDFNYVKDVVRGFIKVAESDESIGKTINISSGKTISIEELVEKIKSIINKEFTIETKDERIRPEKSEVMMLLGDNSEAKNVLGWEPIYSLEQGLTEVVDYVRNNFDKYKEERENI